MHYRIAICDDEPAALAALARMLARELERAGLSADVAPFSGAEALHEAMRETPFDALFLDIDMPGMDGIALADELRAAGVRRVNLSLDTLDAEKYARITRIGCLDDALRGLDAALSAGFDRVKLNAVLLGGFNDDEIPALAGLTRAYPVDVRFIEWMPMGQRPPGAYPLDCGAVLNALPELTALPPDGGVAERYTLPGAKGYVGLIRPVSCQFCAGCNRLRLTADGKLKPCLHSGQEFSVRGLDDAAMHAQFLRAIREKPAQHAPLDLAHQSKAGRSMNEIGG